MWFSNIEMCMSCVTDDFGTTHYLSGHILHFLDCSASPVLDSVKFDSLRSGIRDVMFIEGVSLLQFVTGVNEN